VDYFVAHREAQRAVDAMLSLEAPVTIPDATRRRLVASLQRFQLGESGDGAHLLAGAARGGEAGYAEAASLFVAEEQSHARLLGDLLTRFGAPTLDAHWSDAAFVAARRLMGVAVELAVICVAEGVALVYYGTLAEASPDATVRRVAARILADERAHVPFHAQRIGLDLRRWGPARRAALRLFWGAAGLGATAVVLVDHSAALRDCGLPRRDAAARTWRSVRAVRLAAYRREL